MRIVCISDTHLSHETVKIKIPDGDILIHAGDGTLEGTVRELQDFSRWLAHFHHRHKILIAGNHDLPRGPRLREKWRLIPEGVDILVTHGPPAGILDQTPQGEHVGCADLKEAVERVKPKLHVFGHIHHGHGMEKIGATTFVNASVWDESFEPNNPPLVIDL
jgi:predicted phosphodiesterase